MKVIKNIFNFCGLGTAVILFSLNCSASGQSTTVLVGSSGLKFVPATANIPVNSSVIWSWSGNNHSTTSGNDGTSSGLWDSGVFNQPHTFTNTFNSTGTFPYYCSIHFSVGMLGNIIVTNVAVAPTVSITNPVSGAVLSAPASLTLRVSAADSGGSVTNVRFLEASIVLGNVATSPFSLAVTNLPAASYTFSAIANAANGLTATNSIQVSVITASPVTISGPAIIGAGQFQITYVSSIGLTYVVQVTTNLTSSWTAINTNKATAASTVFTDPNANQMAGYYHVVLQPNP